MSTFRMRFSERDADFRMRFSERDADFRMRFGEVHNISDGGYDRGYADGYEDGHDVATAIVGRTITSYTDHKAKKIGNRVFMQCSALKSIVFTEATEVEDYACAYCRAMTSVSIPKVQTIQGYGFATCTSLEKIELPSAKAIKANAFVNGSALETVILSGDTVCNLADTSAFSGTAIGKGNGYFYVPSVLIEDYKAAANWSTYASQIRAIEDYPEITGG